MFEGGYPLKLIVPGEFIIIFAMTLGLGIVAFGIEGLAWAIFRAWAMIFSGNPQPLSPKDVVVIRTLGWFIWVGGFCAAIMGFTIVMCYLNSDWDIIGEFLAGAMVAILIALGVNALIIQPILSRSKWLAAEANLAKGDK